MRYRHMIVALGLWLAGSILAGCDPDSCCCCKQRPGPIDPPEQVNARLPRHHGLDEWPRIRCHHLRGDTCVVGRYIARDEYNVVSDGNVDHHYFFVRVEALAVEEGNWTGTCYSSMPDGTEPPLGLRFVEVITVPKGQPCIVPSPYVRQMPRELVRPPVPLVPEGPEVLVDPPLRTPVGPIYVFRIKTVDREPPVLMCRHLRSQVDPNVEPWPVEWPDEPKDQAVLHKHIQDAIDAYDTQINGDHVWWGLHYAEQTDTVYVAYLYRRDGVEIVSINKETFEIKPLWRQARRPW